MSYLVYTVKDGKREYISEVVGFSFTKEVDKAYLFESPSFANIASGTVNEHCHIVEFKELVEWKIKTVAEKLHELAVEDSRSIRIHVLTEGLKELCVEYRLVMNCVHSDYVIISIVLNQEF